MERFFFGLCVGAFLILMALRGAALRDERDQLATRVEEQQRVITQLANRPTPAPIVVRVPAPPVVVYAPTPAVQWGVVVVYAVLIVGGVVVLTLMLGVGRAPVSPPDPVLYPGDPGFEEELDARAAAVGAAVIRFCDDYWIKYPTGDPVRVVRLIARGD